MVADIIKHGYCGATDISVVSSADCSAGDTVTLHFTIHPYALMSPVVTLATVKLRLHIHCVYKLTDKAHQPL